MQTRTTLRGVFMVDKQVNRCSHRVNFLSEDDNKVTKFESFVLSHCECELHQQLIICCVVCKQSLL